MLFSLNTSRGFLTSVFIFKYCQFGLFKHDLWFGHDLGIELGHKKIGLGRTIRSISFYFIKTKLRLSFSGFEIQDQGSRHEAFLGLSSQGKPKDSHLGTLRVAHITLRVVHVISRHKHVVFGHVKHFTLVVSFFDRRKQKVRQNDARRWRQRRPWWRECELDAPDRSKVRQEATDRERRFEYAAKQNAIWRPL